MLRPRTSSTSLKSSAVSFGVVSRELLILAALAASLAVLILGFAPIQQPSGYHDLADQRSILGIAHFWNVVSNAPFLVIGLIRHRIKPTTMLWINRGSAAAIIGFGLYVLVEPLQAFGQPLVARLMTQ